MKWVWVIAMSEHIDADGGRRDQMGSSNDEDDILVR